VALDPAVEGETVTETELTELAEAMPTPSTGVSSPARMAPVPKRTRQRCSDGRKALGAREFWVRDGRAD
jgi:hypothetical protein